MSDKFEKWANSLDRIQNEQLIPLLIGRNIFKQLDECIASHVETQTASNLWWWMTRNYFAAVTTGIRKAVEEPSRYTSISLVILMDEIENDNELFTRVRHHSLYKGLPSVLDEIVDRDFDQFADCSDSTCASSSLIRNDIDRLTEVSAKVKIFVDKIVAHTEADLQKIPLLMHGELNDAIDALYAMFKKYSLLVRGVSPSLEGVYNSDDVRPFLRKIWPEKPNL